MEKSSRHIASADSTQRLNDAIIASTRYPTSIPAPSLPFDPTKIEFVDVVHGQEEEEEDYCFYSETNHEILPECTSTKRSMYPFVELLRGAATYIGNHRGETTVIHIASDLLEADILPDLMNDIALCWLMGMRIILIVDSMVDPKTTSELKHFEEEVGFVRFEVERQLNRCLRFHVGMGQGNSDNPIPDGNVIGGNFYTSKRIGDGLRGKPHSVRVDKLEQCLDDNDIVLLTPVGITCMGDLLCVDGCHLAATVASRIKASKLMFITTHTTVLRNKDTKSIVKNLSLSFSKSLLQQHQEKWREDDQYLKRIGWAVSALHEGVTRAHIVGPTNGALLEELFTAKQGFSTCISQDEYESPHPDDEFDDELFPNLFHPEINFHSDA